MSRYPTISSLKTPESLQSRLEELGLSLRGESRVLSAAEGSSLAQPLVWRGGTVGNRFAILPMEGWDGTDDGRPTELTFRRWEQFGISGAKLIWGGEAVAVRPDGRANPRQLLINDANLSSLVELRERLENAHARRFGDTRGLLVGLQLTHSGRFSSPRVGVGREPRTVYRHPILDRRDAVPPEAILSDDDLKRLRDDYIEAAVHAKSAGFSFVDIKHCHGYLGHELLSALDRPGRYGGTLANRMRFLEEIVDGVCNAASIEIGVRLSIFDFVPFAASDSGGEGVPVQDGPYRHAFGGDGTGVGVNLSEPSAFLTRLEALGISLICTTAGSPYYSPHIQRPAAFPPSDGYLPPEDPLLGVVRQIQATAELKRRHPNLVFVGSGYSYLQQYLPHVAQAVVAAGMVDSVGLGRMVLSYPDLPEAVLAGKPLERKRICRTFSDCTTAPRNGMVSGCYPLDPFYRSRPERDQLVALKKDRIRGE